jgi:protein TonB
MPKDFTAGNKRTYLMNIRYLSSAPAGLCMTAALLWVMQLLIASGQEAQTRPRPRIELGWIFVAPQEVVVDDPPPVKPPPPKTPPRDERRQTTSQHAIGVPLPSPPPPVQPTYDSADFGQSNAPLVDVMYVRPIYPVDAAARGLEGFVTVQFDVTELGTVTNVVVLESSHRVFEKPAREAALRSKFRPRVVDGTAMATANIVRRYRFELDD